MFSEIERQDWLSEGIPKKEEQPLTWMEQQILEYQKQSLLETERILYTAEEGSILDKIWKGTYGKDK